MTKMQIATCSVCKNVVELKNFYPELADWELTCGHLYHAETELKK